MIAKSVLEKLYYQNRLSVAEIAERLGTTFPSALYWAHKHQITIRSCSERMYVKLNPDGDPFDPKKNLMKSEQTLLTASLALYWGEGCRKGHYGVQLGNLDARMLQVFMRFLREIARVQESRIRVDARIHEQFSKAKAHQYWSRILAVPPGQVFVYHHMDPRSRPEKQWSPYGLAAVSVHNTKLKAWMDRQLDQHIDYLLRRSSMTETSACPQGGHSFASETLGTYNATTHDAATHGP